MVALTNAGTVALSASNETVAVFLSKSIRALPTPGTVRAEVEVSQGGSRLCDGRLWIRVCLALFGDLLLVVMDSRGKVRRA